MSQPMIRPAQVDTLPFLDATQKQQYKAGLHNLWQQYESNPDGSPQKQEAYQKLVAASSKIMQQISQRNRPGGASQGQRPGNQNGGQGGQSQVATQQNQSAAPQVKPSQQQQGQSGQPGQQGDPDAVLKARISAEVSAVQVFPPSDITTQPQYEAHKTQFKTQLGSLRFKVEKHKMQQEQLMKHFAQLKAQGRDPGDEYKSKYVQIKNVVESLNQQIVQLNQQNEQNKMAHAMRKNGAAGGANGAGAGGAGGVGQVTRTPVNGDQSSTPRPGTQHGNPNATQDGSRPQQLNAAPSASPAQVQAAAQLAAQQRPPQMSQAGQQNQQQSIPQGQAQRPPLNPQAAAQYAAQYGAGPASGIPQNATSQRPHALSQQGAIAKAQEQNYQQTSIHPQQQQQPQQQQAQPAPQPGSNGFNQAPPQHQQNQGTPTSATTPHPHQSQQLNNKFPIPKNLQLGPQTQTPVPGAPARPTMMNHSGVLNVPGIQKPPPFNLEGEGDHVLSKRKLDELVRQITGSTNPADGLTPEVEEAVLSLTDDFVDNVITKACQMAKLRQGQTLELRDIQIVLERNYGIRIPGYALDEVRAVRKFQPSQGWISKVQAVQNAKIMGSSRDGA